MFVPILLAYLCSPSPSNPSPPPHASLSETISGGGSRSSFEVTSIGTVISPYLSKVGTPKQATVLTTTSSSNTSTTPSLATGTLQILPQYKDCLLELDGFDYCWQYTNTLPISPTISSLSGIMSPLSLTCLCRVLAYMNRNSGFKTTITPMPRPNAVNKPPNKV